MTVGGAPPFLLERMLSSNRISFPHQEKKAASCCQLRGKRSSHLSREVGGACLLNSLTRLEEALSLCLSKMRQRTFRFGSWGSSVLSGYERGFFRRSSSVLSCYERGFFRRSLLGGALQERDTLGLPRITRGGLSSCC